MVEQIVSQLLLLIGAYAAAGLLCAVWLHWSGLRRIDPGVEGAGLFFRLLITPGMIALWPLLLAGITTLAAANRYLRERFLPDFNAEFARPPAEPTPAFVPLGPVDLEQILCHQDERTVARDNTVTLDGVVLQLAKQATRRSCAGLRVVVRRHLDGRHSVWLGPAPPRPLRCAWSRAARGRGMTTLRRFRPGGDSAPAPIAALRACKVARGVAATIPSGHFTVSNSCGQITYHRHPMTASHP